MGLGLDLKGDEKGLGMPKWKMVMRRKMREIERAIVKKLVNKKLIRAVRLRDLL